MAQSITSYRLSLAADKDLDKIFDHTLKEFGLSQAITYLESIENVFNKLISNPKIGKQRNEIKLGLRSIPIGEHVVFYRLMKNHIRIVRVLYSKKDLPNSLK